MTVTEERPTWSKSALEEFHLCQRKYFLSRYSAPESEPTALKKLKNRFLWSGSIVHETVGEVIKLISQGQDVPQTTEIIEQVHNRMRAEFKSSQNGDAAENRLFEHEYNFVLSKEIWKQNWEKVKTSLTWFMGSKWLERLKQMKPEHWKIVDEVVSFDVDGIKTFTKIDCALMTEEKTILIDWKTSSLRPQDSGGLVLNALYAHEVWDAFPENMEGFVVSLFDGAHQRITFDEDALMNMYMKIQEQSAALSESTAAFSLETDPMSISMTTDLNQCGRCNYQRICHPGGIQPS